MTDYKYNIAFKQKVAWGDMDAFGHVNNTVYLKYFETARVNYFNDIPELREFKKEELPVIVNLSCNYKKAVVYPDDLTIEVGVVEFGAASLKMACNFISPKVGLAAQAECTIVLVNAKKGHSIRIPQSWKDVIAKVEGGLV